MGEEQAPHGHGHGHLLDHEDWAASGERLETEAELALDALDGAARWLGSLVEPVRRVLDVGSGPGVAACRFAGVFTQAQVTAVDGAAPLLDRAASRAARLGVGERVAVEQRELPDGLAGLEPSDIVWASRVVHHLGDQAAAVQQLASLVRPGGVLALAEGGLPQRTLPRDIGIGPPGLEARLDVALQDWFADMRAEQPGAVATVEHWPALLADAGLTPFGTRSFLVDHPAPLDTATRAVVIDGWHGIRDRLGDRIAREDRATLDRLLDPDDDAGLYRRPDLFLLTANTVHVGRAPTP